MNVGKIELPIEIEDIDCITDCWVFNRLIIIKTSPYYEDWIASHYNLFATSEYNFHFGDLSLSEPNYHDDILERKQLNVLKIDQNNVVLELSKKISEGYYINIFVKSNTEIDHFHEVVIYGFDNFKNDFLVVEHQNRGFKKSHISYDFLIDTWPDIKKYFISNSFRGMELSMNFQYPATLFKIKHGYNIENCAVEAYKKLRKELQGTKLNIFCSQEFLNYKEYRIQYQGIECLSAIFAMINDALNGKEFVSWFRGKTSAIKKLYEHRKMILLSMRYVYKKWQVCMSDESLIYIEKYQENLKIVEKWLSLSLRYELTNNKHDLEIVLNDLPTVYRNEKNILNNFVYHTINWDIFNENFI